MKLFEQDKDFAKYETLFYMGNGKIGIRNSLEEKSFNRATYINGFYDTFDIHYEEMYTGFSVEGEKMIQVFDGQKLEIFLDNELVPFESDFESHERYIDMSNGTYVRNYVYVYNGHKINFEVVKLVSFTHECVALAKYRITCDTAKVTVKNYILSYNERNVDKSDIRVDHNVERVEITKNELGILEGISKREKNKISLSYRYDVNFENIKLENGVVNILPGEFERVFFYDSEQFEISSSELIAEQGEFLNKFWENAKINFSNKKFDEKINYSLYALLQSTPLNGSGKVSVAAKGISGDGYCGHYFWDTEMYLFPIYLWTNPELAKNLLEYRYNILGHAMENARKVGYTQGALYPWRTINGKEASGYFEAGMAQHHISLDIAYAFINYYRVTNDKAFMLTKGLEVIEETAKLFLGIGFEKDGAFHIDMVTGPDEYTALVDDNYYTNILCKYNFEWLVKIADELGVEIERKYDYVKYAEMMYKKTTDNITWQDRDFLNKKVWDFENNNKSPLLMHYHPLNIYRHQVCKQPDVVLAHVLREEEVSYDELVATTNYYESVTTHDSSLSFSIFAIMYCRMKNEAMSYDYFMKNALLDIDDIHHNTKDGIHVAAMGGTWMVLLNGFAGLRLKENGLNFYPFLPKEIGTFEMKMNYLGRTLQIKVEHDTFNVKLIEGEELVVYIDDEAIQLA